MPKKPTVKAHRGFIHIPRRGENPRRPPRFPGFPGFPRFPGIGGPRRPIRQPYPFPGFPRRPRPYPPELIKRPKIKKPRDLYREPVRPPRAMYRPKRPTGDPRPDIRRDPKKLRDFIRRQREQQRVADNFRRLRDALFVEVHLLKEELKVEQWLNLKIT